jgi:hypothetical protein
MDRAASPSKGLAANVGYMNLAKFKEWLDEWYDEHLTDVSSRKAKQIGADQRRRSPPPDADVEYPGRLANVFIYATHERYPSLCEWAQTSDPKWVKHGQSSDGRDGIWIPLSRWRDGAGSIGMYAKETVR